MLKTPSKSTNNKYEVKVLLVFTDDVSNSLEGKQTDVPVMDFAKAFDKVWHSLLLHKLHHYGIQGKTNS